MRPRRGTVQRALTLCLASRSATSRSISNLLLMVGRQALSHADAGADYTVSRPQCPDWPGRDSARVQEAVGLRPDAAGSRGAIGQR
jgi:hypothetical protein